MELRIADTEISYMVEGPGNRFVIWVQGCSIRCKGCWNKKLWNFEGGKLMNVEKLVNDIEKLKEKIDGITIIGGEPLDQVQAVNKLIKRIKKKGYSVLLYTGYTKDEIFRDKLKKEAFKNSDIVIYGPFKEELKDLSLKWRGSSNQIIHVNNPRYNYILNDENVSEKVEIHFDDTGEIKIIGYPNKNLIKYITSKITNEQD